MPDIASGVLPVLETPFDHAGAVDVDSFISLLRHLRAAGADGVMFPGFASEFAKLADDERRELTTELLGLTREWTDFAAIVSVPDHATRIAVMRAEQAVEDGADAINVLPPHFLSPSRDAILDHLRAILAAVGATPVIVQLAPALTGGSLGIGDLAALAAEHENFVCVKVETTPPGRTVEALLTSAPSLTCLVGYAGIHLPDALERGATGVQPGSSFVELYVELWDHWIAGRREQFDALHRRLLPYLSIWMTSVEFIVQVEKTISRERGLITTDVCRQPGYRLDVHERRLVDRFLQEFGESWVAS